jgi:hypothetical protein
MRRAFFEGMVLRGWNANLLSILLQTALEHVAILNPCPKSKAHNS